MELDKKLLKYFNDHQQHNHHQQETNNPNISNQNCHNIYIMLNPHRTECFGTRNSLAVQIFNSFFKFSKLTRDNYYRIATEQINVDMFKRFLSAIIFIGHCSNGEMHHYHRLQQEQKLTYHDDDLCRIKQIQPQDKNPVWLLCFNGISQCEAEYRTGLMTESIGSHNLTPNQHQINTIKTCDNSNCLLDDNDDNNREQKRIIEGTYLLMKSFLAFIISSSTTSTNGHQRQASIIDCKEQRQQQMRLLNQLVLFDEHL